METDARVEDEDKGDELEEEEVEVEVEFEAEEERLTACEIGTVFEPDNAPGG